MRRDRSYGSFAEFRDEVLRHRNGPLTSAVDEIADEIYHSDVQDDFDKLWDSAGDDEF
jgi:hypothetical protein